MTRHSSNGACFYRRRKRRRPVVCAAPPAAAAVAATTGNWADLHDLLLLSVLDRLPCLHDVFAVAAVCRSWRAVAYSSLSSPSVGRPPLLLCPRLRWEDRSSRRRRFHPNRCELVSPLRTSAPSRARVAPRNLRCFLGYAYGQLIVCVAHYVVIVDIFTGVELLLPAPTDGLLDFSYGTLTRPLTQPGSNLLLCTTQCIFWWAMEGSAWEVCHGGPYDFPIVHILAFKDEIFGVGKDDRLYAIELTPCFRVKQLAVREPEEMLVTFTYNQLLLECGGELMLLRLVPDKIIHKKVDLYRLIFSEQLEWVKVDSLGDCALFIDDVSKTATSCAHPGRWGGRSNCIYYAGPTNDWVVFPLDKTAYILNSSNGRWPSPIWVYPSMVYRPER